MSARVLVVDDSLMVRTQVTSVLTAAGFSVHTASDGVEALQKVGELADTKLIVCDVNMPRMSGLEFLEALKEGGVSIPVIMLTSEQQPDMIQRAKALGAKGWIAKPPNPEMLVRVARELAAV